MVNLLFDCKFNVGVILFRELKKFNESFLLSKAAGMSSMYLQKI